jgi:hypothetical protein
MLSDYRMNHKSSLLLSKPCGCEYVSKPDAGNERETDTVTEMETFFKSLSMYL